MNRLLLILCTIVAMVSPATARGDIVTRFGDGTIPLFDANTGTQTIDIFIRRSSTEPGITAYLTTFSIVPPSALSGAALIGPLGNGTFGQTGFFGTGAITSGAASFFTRLSSTTAQLSLELSSATVVPATFTTIARMQIDTANLPAGNYAVNVSPQGVQDLIGTTFNAQGVGGSFTITSVPEPTSVCLVLVGGLGSWIARRRFLNMRASPTARMLQG